MLSALVLSLAASSTAMVPPGYMVEDHSQPGHFTQPTIRWFERHDEDHDRRTRYESFSRELDALWAEYKKTNTPAAFRVYKQKAAAARRQYVHDDPYLAPVVRY